MPIVDPQTIEEKSGSSYPPPFDAPCNTRSSRALTSLLRLTQFGVNVVRLPPGAWSSQRHWHTHEDEFAYVLSGEVVLVTDEGKQTLVTGQCAGFPAGDRNGHCFQNHSESDVELLVVGSRDARDHGEYPDIDLKFDPDRYESGATFRYKDGTPY